MFGPRDQRRGDRDRVGDDGELAVERKQLGQPHRRGAGVEDDRAAVGELVERRAGDALLLVDGVHLAVGDARLDAEALDRDRAAVHATQHAAPLEGGQITPDGLRCDGQFPCESRDLDPAADAGGVEDLLVTLRCVQQC